jgi:hypothetical protein
MLEGMREVSLLMVAAGVVEAAAERERERERETQREEEEDEEVVDALDDGIKRFFSFLSFLSNSPPSNATSSTLLQQQPSTAAADYMNLPSPVRYEELQREVMSESENGDRFFS